MAAETHADRLSFVPRPRATVTSFRTTRHRHVALTVDFINVGLTLAANYCGLATRMSDFESSLRCLDLAVQAYRKAEKFSASLEHAGRPYPQTIDEKLRGFPSLFEAACDRVIASMRSTEGAVAAASELQRFF